MYVDVYGAIPPIHHAGVLLFARLPASATRDPGHIKVPANRRS